MDLAVRHQIRDLDASSSGPVSAASTRCTSCAMSWDSTPSRSTRPAASAAPGTGTGTPARCRTREAFVYQYSFDRDLYTQRPVDDAGTWSEPEILAYLKGVVDRYDLREHIQLDTGMTEA